MSSSLHVDDKKKYTSLQILTAEKKYSINFTNHNKNLALFMLEL